jgi:hypothetical protein
MLPEEPGVSPRSNSERPYRQISSRSFVSLMLSVRLLGRLLGPFSSPELNMALRSAPA